MKNAVFLDVTPCCSCKSRRFGEKYPSIIRVNRISELETSAVTNNCFFEGLCLLGYDDVVVFF
jgi:hypothetical protein